MPKLQILDISVSIASGVSLNSVTFPDVLSYPKCFGDTSKPLLAAIDMHSINQQNLPPGVQYSSSLIVLIALDNFITSIPTNLTAMVNLGALQISTYNIYQPFPQLNA
jgi:hypothetical protein